MKTLESFSLLCIVTLLAADSATAQVAATTTDQPAEPAPSAQQPQPTSSPSPSPSATDTSVERIIVTANKIEENIQDVPSSISVITDVQIDNLHATQLTDYAAYVPGLQVVGGGTPGRTSITLRGIAPIGAGAQVGTYIDETPTGSSGFFQGAAGFALDLLPYDIERVEVLRGPQGTLYGAGSMGGLLKYVTRNPDLENREFRVGGGVSGVEGGGDPGWDVSFGANLPLVKDRLALRVSYARNALPGFIDNVVNGKTDINTGTQESSRAALLWQINNDVSLELVFMRQSIDSDNFGQVALDPVTLRPLYGDLKNSVFVDEAFTNDINLYTATLKANLGWADLTVATGYSDLSTFLRGDNTIGFGDLPTLFGLPSGLVKGDLNLRLKKFSQEIRLTSKQTGPLEWQLGVFYTKEDGENKQVTNITQLDGTAYPPLPSPPLPFTNLDPLTDAALPSDYEEVALFGHAAYKITERLKLGAGLRYAYNDQNFTQVINPSSLSALGFFVTPGRTPGSSNESVVTWSVSPQFELAKDVMLYGQVATGYQPGGPNIAFPGVPPTVDASTLISYEVGLKSEFADHKILLNLAAFRIDWKDIQVGTSVNTGIGVVTVLTNAGEATSQGVELSAAFFPIKGLQFGLNGAYTDATLSNDLPTAGTVTPGLSGDGLPYVPEFSGSATVDYYFPIAHDWNAHIGAGFRWVGERPLNFSNRDTSLPPGADITPAPTLDSYYGIDLNADITHGQWTLRAFARNVTDERAYLDMFPFQNALTGANVKVIGVPIQPRTVGLEIEYKF